MDCSIQERVNSFENGSNCMNSLTRCLLPLPLLPLLLCAQPEAAYQVATVKTVMLPMRNGIKLATDIYFPARGGTPAEGKFPVVLERTPYNKDVGSTAAAHLVPHGYIVIFQDVRGRYTSLL